MAISASKRSKIGANAASLTTSAATFNNAASIRTASTARVRLSDGTGTLGAGVMTGSMARRVWCVEGLQPIRARRPTAARKSDGPMAEHRLVSQQIGGTNTARHRDDRDARTNRFTGVFPLVELNDGRVVFGSLDWQSWAPE